MTFNTFKTFIFLKLGKYYLQNDPTHYFPLFIMSFNYQSRRVRWVKANKMQWTVGNSLEYRSISFLANTLFFQGHIALNNWQNTCIYKHTIFSTLALTVKGDMQWKVENTHDLRKPAYLLLFLLRQNRNGYIWSRACILHIHALYNAYVLTAL